MLVVAALGGNALLERGQPLTPDAQRANVQRAAKALAQIIHAGHRLVITHGNGPQVGLLALQSGAGDPTQSMPLDLLDAETEGMIGYLIEQELENALHHSAMVATVLTQVEVDPRDPAFQNPTKFIGPQYDEAEARKVAEPRGWRMARDGGRWRRVVASPEPRRILDLRVLRLLLENGVIVVCAGGGGVPVISLPNGAMTGVEAVIDKDRASALLATGLGADALLLLTDVDAVYRDFGTPERTAIRAATPEELGQLTLPAGSMGPKAEAAARFVSDGGAMAAIGALGDAAAMLEGAAGTVVTAAL